MRLFSEKVEPTFTSSNLNILTVEDFQEIFYDVFEFEINGKKFVAEKTSEYKGSPVVDIPLVLEGKELTAPFILQRGKFEILFNRDNSTFIGEAVEDYVDPVVDVKSKEEAIEAIIFEKREDIIEEITQARLSAEKYAQEIKQQKINEAIEFFDEKKKLVDSAINESKKGLLGEFLLLVESIKSEIYSFNEDERDGFIQFIEKSVEEKTAALVSDINEKHECVEQKFKEQINELAANILSNVLLKEIDINNAKSLKDINERFDVISSSIKKLIKDSDNKIKDDINTEIIKINESILTLEKVNVELNDQINKGDNKALSRIGNVKTQLEKNILDNNALIYAHLDDTEERVKAYYNDKLSIIEEKVVDLSHENKQYFVDLINESKQSLLNEISNIKVDVPNIVIERSNGKQEVDLKGIKTELEKIIGTRFSNELQSLKRLIEMSSGGGSVARQFANGGTMEGTLNVTGRYLSGGVDLLDIFTGGGGGSDDVYVNTLVRGSSANWDKGYIGYTELGLLSGNWTNTYTTVQANSADWSYQGTDLKALSGNWQNTFTEVQTNSADWSNAYNIGTVYQSNSSTYATIDFSNSKFFPLSGGTIAGETRINNNLTVFGNLTATGTTTFANTVFSVTSSLSVVHVGSGPAVWVGNNGDGDIASFYDIDQGIEILHVGGINSANPNVGIKTSTPNKTLTVVGEISSTSDITTNGSIYTENNGNSIQWNTAYNLVSGNNLVYTENDQTINGVKTFNDLPLIPVAPVSGANPASKDYVDTLVSSVSSSIQDSLLGITENSSNLFALSATYNNKVVQCTSTTSITAILPSSLPQGFNCMLIQLSSGQINIQGEVGVTVGSFGNLVKTAGQHAPVSIICLAPGVYNISGNLI